jgi:hypothetical protein
MKLNLFFFIEEYLVESNERALGVSNQLRDDLVSQQSIK